MTSLLFYFLIKLIPTNQEELGEIKFLAGVYREIGYTCIGISALTGKNIETVRALMMKNTSMFAGHSGAGKSTLVNALESGLDLKTAAISEQHLQGQHTTTFAEMYDLSFGGRIIDTPGIKGFGVVDMEKEEIGDYFPEFFALKEDCKIQQLPAFERTALCCKGSFGPGKNFLEPLPQLCTNGKRRR